MDSFKNPSPAVDAVIFYRDTESIILIKRKNPPHDWALPGGFVNEGESLEDAVRREMREELRIDVFLWEQFYTYSDPRRDPRKHVMSTVFIASTMDKPVAGDDAAETYIFSTRVGLPENLVFDHSQIVADVFHYMKSGSRRRLDR